MKTSVMKFLNGEWMCENFLNKLTYIKQYTLTTNLVIMLRKITLFIITLTITK